MSETITFTFEARWVWGIGLTLGLALLIIGITLVLPSTPDKVPFEQFKERMGPKKVPDVVIAFGAAFLIAVLALSVQAIFAAYAVSAPTITSLLSETPAPATETSGPSLGAGTLIIGLLGAPFLIWRTLVAQRTVDIAQENHITDLINKAVEGLGSDKEDGKPNIEVRIGAILALERLAQKNLDVHIQIMEILTAYIRHNAPASGAANVPTPNLHSDGHRVIPQEAWARWRRLYAARLRRLLSTSGQDGTPIKPRADVQMALRVIGRRSSTQKSEERGKVPAYEEAGLFPPDFPTSIAALPKWKTANDDFVQASDEWASQVRRFRLNLSDTNLQGADLENSDFQNALLEKARLDGASFRRARLQGAVLRDSYLIGAQMVATQSQMVDFGGSQMQGANLTDSQMQGANFGGALMGGASLSFSNLKGSQFDNTSMTGTSLLFTNIRGATWLGAQLRGADLARAEMQGSLFWEVQIDDEVSLTNAVLEWSLLKNMDLSQSTLERSRLRSMFGDGSVTLPVWSREQ